MSRRTANLVWASTLAGVCAVVAVLNLGAPGSWDDLGVPTITPQWADARAITLTAECRARGIDPWTPNDCNERNVPNYPRVWLTIADLLGRSTGLLAGLCIGVFLAGIALLFWHLRPGPIAIGLFVLGVLGPPAVLAYERANIELVVVGLAAVAGILLARRELAGFVAGTVLMTGAALLKVYPASLLIVPIAIAFTAQQPERAKRIRIGIAGGAVLVTAVVLFAQWNDLRRIEQNVPRPATVAYGFRTFQEFIRENGLGATWERGAAYYVAVLAVLAFVIWRSVRGPRPLRRRTVAAALTATTTTVEGIALLSGAALFVTSLFFASYPYRLLVLSLLLPACATVLQRDRVGGPSPGPVRAALALVVLVVALGCTTMLEVHLRGPALALATNLTMIGAVGVLCLTVSLALGLSAWDTASTSPDPQASRSSG
jgi:hypothetical protein